MTDSTIVTTGRGKLNVAGIGSVLGLTTADCLLLTGSRVLPFETGSADVDLFVIAGSPRTVAALAERRHEERLSEQLANGYSLSYITFDGEELDVEVWPVDIVQHAIFTLGTEVASIDQIERDFTRVGSLETKVGTDLFHALLLGCPLVGGERFAELRAQVPWRVFLAWKRDTHLVNVRDAVKGIAKSLRDGRTDEAYLKLCWAADNLVDGMIFHHGYSISRWKWRLRYLELLDPWLDQWYRTVRFPSVPLDAQQIGNHRETLASTWREHVGRPSADVAEMRQEAWMNPRADSMSIH